MEAPKIVHNLSLARVPLSPTELFIKSAENCKELGINTSDVYGDYPSSVNDSWLKRFELEISSYFGKESAIFLTSGVLAQSIALKISQENVDKSRNRFICHYTSHVLNHEQGGFKDLLNLEAVIAPAAGPDLTVTTQLPLSYNDVKDHLNEEGPNKPIALIVEVPHRGN